MAQNILRRDIGEQVELGNDYFRLLDYVNTIGAIKSLTERVKVGIRASSSKDDQILKMGVATEE